MSIPPTILLSMLSSGVRAARGAVAGPEGVSSASDFGSLLTRAKAGEVSTGLAVSVARGAEIELSDAQLERLAVAADRAQAAGATRVLAFVDGRALEIDIATRTVTREHAVEHARAITGIDAVIDAGVTNSPSKNGEQASGLVRQPAIGDGAILPPPSSLGGWSPAVLDSPAHR